MARAISERPLQVSASIVQPESTTMGALNWESLATKASIPLSRLLILREGNQSQLSRNYLIKRINDCARDTACKFVCFWWGFLTRRIKAILRVIINLSKDARSRTTDESSLALRNRCWLAVCHVASSRRYSSPRRKLPEELMDWMILIRTERKPLPFCISSFKFQLDHYAAHFHTTAQNTYFVQVLGVAITATVAASATPIAGHSRSTMSWCNKWDSGKGCCVDPSKLGCTKWSSKDISCQEWFPGYDDRQFWVVPDGTRKRPNIQGKGHDSGNNNGQDNGKDQDQGKGHDNGMDKGHDNGKGYDNGNDNGHDKWKGSNPR
ncbi:hypothetical protein KC353_g30 [Hortaea werneckii]|nr:hypothetical protein KC353_g30 [Hortaea werneckii]